jgi:urease accessory protein
MTRLPSKSIMLMTMATALLLPTLAVAHPAYDAAYNFATGFLHPLSGLDHVLAALAVGLWAAQLGGRAGTRLPLAFLASIALGALLGKFVAAIPASEALVMGSVLMLALLVTLRVRASLWVAASLVSLFGAAHGYVHAIEAPLTVGASYLLGVIAGNLPLLLAGVWIGARVMRSRRARVS